MTTNTPNQELIFPFGETPEEVIREQYDLRRNQYDELHIESYGVFHGVTGLLTVLDALETQYVEFNAALETWVGDDGLDNPAQAAEHDRLWKGATRAKALRISILAALGINEGGE